MKNPLKRLFRVPDGERSRLKVILWWELRRIPYNLILAATFEISYRISELIIGGPFEFMSLPFGMLFFIFGANVCYTGGWLVEGSLHLSSNGGSKEFASRAFKYGLLFSMFLVLIPTIILAVLAVSGSRMPSPLS